MDEEAAEDGARLNASTTPVAGRILIAAGEEQPCLVSITLPDRALVMTTATGCPGAEAICYLDGIGAVSGRIETVTARGFKLRLDLSDSRRKRVAARIAWRDEQGDRAFEQRKDPRLIPHHRAVAVRLPDGPASDGSILDLSRTGAKIQLTDPVTFSTGALIVVGKRYATVVRIEDTAFAVRFLLPLSESTFNPSVVL